MIKAGSRQPGLRDQPRARAAIGTGRAATGTATSVPPATSVPRPRRCRVAVPGAVLTPGAAAEHTGTCNPCPTATAAPAVPVSCPAAAACSRPPHHPTRSVPPRADPARRGIPEPSGHPRAPPARPARGGGRRGAAPPAGDGGPAAPLCPEPGTRTWARSARTEPTGAALPSPRTPGLCPARPNPAALTWPRRRGAGGLARGGRGHG